MRKNIGSMDKIIRFVTGAVQVWTAYSQQVTSLYSYIFL